MAAPATVTPLKRVPIPVATDPIELPMPAISELPRPDTIVSSFGPTFVNNVSPKSSAPVANMEDKNPPLSVLVLFPEVLALDPIDLNILSSLLFTISNLESKKLI